MTSKHNTVLIQNVYKGLKILGALNLVCKSYGLRIELSGLNSLMVGPHKELKLKGSHLPKAMSLPVRPPTLLRTSFTLCAAPLKAGPAEEVTLERPSEALEVIFEAASFDLAVVFEAACAASEVVEACRKVFDRVTKRVCRSIKRNAGVDMGRASNRDDSFAEMKIAKRNEEKALCRG